MLDLIHLRGHVFIPYLPEDSVFPHFKQQMQCPRRLKAYFQRGPDHGLLIFGYLLNLVNLVMRICLCP